MLTYKKDRYFKDGTGLEIQSARTVDKPQPEHLHEFIEIVYVSNGTGVHGIDGVEYKVSRGSLLFINYRQVHYFKSENDMVICNILLDPEWISEKLIDSENAFELLTLSAFSSFQQEVDTGAPLIRFEGASRARLERLIAEMEEEKQKKLPGFDTVLKAQVNILLTSIFRKMSRGGRLYLNPDFLGYIRDHCNEKLTLEALSKTCFYNPSYFSRLFREHYGMTVTEFINQSRLEKAVKMLEETGLSVEEISEQAGFSSKTAFYKLLRKKTGLTPQEYRKKVKNQNDFE